MRWEGEILFQYPRMRYLYDEMKLYIKKFIFPFKKATTLCPIVTHVLCLRGYLGRVL